MKTLEHPFYFFRCPRHLKPFPAKSPKTYSLWNPRIPDPSRVGGRLLFFTPPKFVTRCKPPCRGGQACRPMRSSESLQPRRCYHRLPPFSRSFQSEIPRRRVQVDSVEELPPLYFRPANTPPLLFRFVFFEAQVFNLFRD